MAFSKVTHAAIFYKDWKMLIQGTDGAPYTGDMAGSTRSYRHAP